MMTELLNEAQPSALSTQLDDRQADPTGNSRTGALDDTNPPEQPGSNRDAIAKAFDEQDKAAAEEAKKVEPEVKAKEPVKEAKVEPKPEDEEPKPDAEKQKAEGRAADGQREEAGEEGERRPRPSEGKNFPEPPSRLLPKEKEAWANVPNVVKGAIDRITREHEAEVTQYRESHENWQKLAPYSEMAAKHNTTVDEALKRYTSLDWELHNNPIEGIRRVLTEVVKISPEEYARHVLNNPQAHQAPAAPRQPDPVVNETRSEVAQLRAQIEEMRQEQVAQTVITPFKSDHPRYDELQGDIVFFLESGKIPQSLSPYERLEAAYDMAERINPRSTVQSQPSAFTAPEPPTDPEPAVDLRGAKSIRGTPSAGFDPALKGKSKNNRDAIEASLAAHGL